MNKKKVIINKLKKQKNFYLNLRYLYLKQLSN
ncbi:ORF B [Toxoplasma gondii CAST]|nr:ORF B [Toxoplasma gondii CAST]